MERLRAIADAHYRASPPAAKALAYEFFKTLDSDGDGRVSINEFLSLMKEQGHVRLANPYFFRELDSNGNGSLDFWEVLTLYYIVKSGRPVCECCGILVTGTFFSCVECFDSPAGAYSLCILCYRSNKSDHNHGGRQQFLDAFTLLETKKRFSANGRSAPRPADVNHHPHHHHHHQQSSPHTTHATQVVYHSNRPQPQPWTPPPPQTPDNHHHAIVPATHMEMWKTALATLEVGLSIGTISTTLCTIL
ncbi:hypothetical protein ABFS82_14G029800 [Erythranthe guttata]|uniref:EF-hand domain-containing protein n=1 Tax=Erythranthe guttata TaxID=4155 RepID=A0A022QYF5_ERYGU|nr:hypothetical protein MIMGU_mgv1a012547mg [Erythranthe guttata]